MSQPAHPLRVAVAGAATPIGRETFRALSQSTEFSFVLALDSAETGKNVRDLAGPRATDLVIEDKVGAALDRVEADILLDFSVAAAAMQHAVSALKRRVAPILGCSLSSSDQRELSRECAERETPALVAPTLSIGEVLLIHFAEIAAQWLPEVQVLELQPDSKADQLSAFSRAVAEHIAQGVDSHRPPGSKAGEKTPSWQDIKVHSLKLRGARPSHSTVFSAPGELLTLSHEHGDCSSCVEGVRLAILEIWNQSGLIVGLDRLMFD